MVSKKFYRYFFGKKICIYIHIIETDLISLFKYIINIIIYLIYNHLIDLILYKIIAARLL